MRPPPHPNHKPIKPTPERGGAAEAFSRAALHYDRDQSLNRVARWSRLRSLSILKRLYSPRSRLLEIGCGTGEEAISLAMWGASIHATDAAPGMISILRQKLFQQPSKVKQRITAEVVPASGLAALINSTQPQFDGIYSSFGPLNCEADLKPIAEALSKLVKPGGYLALSFINRYCLWETLWHLLHRDPHSAFRRWSGYTEATVRNQWQETRIPVYYPSLTDLQAIFSPYFTLINRTSLPWLLPPQYLDRLLNRHPALFRLLARLDCAFASSFPFNRIGDHVLLILRRPPTAPWSPPHLSPPRSALRRLKRAALNWRYRNFTPGHAAAHYTRVAGRRLHVERTVFDPSLHYTSASFARYLERSLQSRPVDTEVLDLGTGTGLLAIVAAQSGRAQVTAVDINPLAAKSAQRNVEAHGLSSQVRVLQSDLFSAVESSRYNLIITNPPFYPITPATVAEQAYYAGSDLSWFARLAVEAPIHLAPSGQLLIILSDTAPVNRILNIFKSHGWTHKLLAQKNLVTESMAIFSLVPTAQQPNSPNP